MRRDRFALATNSQRPAASVVETKGRACWLHVSNHNNRPTRFPDARGGTGRFQNRSLVRLVGVFRRELLANASCSKASRTWPLPASGQAVAGVVIHGRASDLVIRGVRAGPPSDWRPTCGCRQPVPVVVRPLDTMSGGTPRRTYVMGLTSLAIAARLGRLAGIQPAATALSSAQYRRRIVHGAGES